MMWTPTPFDGSGDDEWAKKELDMDGSEDADKDDSHLAKIFEVLDIVHDDSTNDGDDQGDDDDDDSNAVLLTAMDVVVVD